MKATIWTTNGREFRFRGGMYLDAHGKPLCNDIDRTSSYQCTREPNHLDNHKAEDTGVEWKNSRVLFLVPNAERVS